MPIRYSPHDFTTSSLNSWHKGGWIHTCCLHQILTLPSKRRSRNQDSSDQATFFQSSIVQFWGVCVNCSLSFLFVADRITPVWCSAAVAYLLQGLMCCAFRDALLQTLVVTSGLSYCCLSNNANQSGQSPLTSTRHFWPHNCHFRPYCKF